MKKNNKLIIIISMMFALTIAVGIFVCLFFMTDIFKSEKELFVKYFMQNTEIYNRIMDLNTIQVLDELGNENKYETNTIIKTTYSEGGEISNQMNDFSAQIDIQKNNDEQYAYADAQMIYKDQKLLETEFIKEQRQYGLKFPGISKKYVTIQRDEKLEAIANDLGIDVPQLEKVLDIIDGNVDTTSELKIDELKNKYLNIIKTEISKGTFKKQKEALITYNGITTKTNAYSVSLTSEQVTSLLIEILNNLKSETDLLNKLQTIIKIENVQNLIDEAINSVNESIDIPTIKITVYEQKQQTIRTIAEIGTYKFIIENVEENEQIKSKIQYRNSNETAEYNVEINKLNNINQEQFEIVINAIDNNENYTITILNEMSLMDNEINIKTNISHKQNITIKAVNIASRIIKGTDFVKKQTLEQDNFILLNTLEEAIRQQFIAELKERIPQEIDNKINKQVEQKNEDENEEQMPQIEINKFNAKFEFYTGEEVSGENVKKLLEIVKDNILGHVITTIEEEGNTNGNKKTKNMISIYIEKDKKNEESMAKILEIIEQNKKYKISISYKDINGLIDSITITQK